MRFVLALLLSLVLLAATPARPDPLPPIPSGCLQAVLVLTPDWEARQGQLQRYWRGAPGCPWQPLDENVTVNVGRAGLGWGRGLHPSAVGPGPVKREGDGRSPAGVFRLSAVFGVRDPHPGQGGLPFLQTTEWLEGVDDPASRYYNRLVDRRQVADADWTSSERMQIPLYEIGVVVDHNAPPAVPGAGSCIFMHLWRGLGYPTAGCTSMDRTAMAGLAAWLEAGAQPVLIQLPLAEYQRRREAWQLPGH